MNPVLLQIAMIALGAAVLIAGFGVLVSERLNRRRDRKLRLSGEPPAARARRFTEPTRITLSLVLMLAGYHLIAWAFPVSWFHVQLPRDLWWVWGLGGVIAVALSVAIDRLEGRLLGEGGSQGRADGGNGPSKGS